MLRQIIKPKGSVEARQGAEQAAPHRRVAQAAGKAFFHPNMDKSFQVSGFVEDTDSRELGSCEVACALRNAIEHLADATLAAQDMSRLEHLA
jgi:hypothetical protein